MRIWHSTADAPAPPRRVLPGTAVAVDIGTWPVEPDQSVWVTYRLRESGVVVEGGSADAIWRRNAGANSYWRAELGPFPDGARVEYEVHGHSPDGCVNAPVRGAFTVGPAVYLALLWHQHQPLYRLTTRPPLGGSYAQPWVRLHAIRDYYGMAALVAEHPGVHVTINLTPVLLAQLADYAECGATDRALDLTLTPAEDLTRRELEEIAATFFDAHWHNQIFPHPRYAELFAARRDGRALGVQEIRDLQMWFNLAWFAEEFREGEVRLATGEIASVRRFVEQRRDFSRGDVEAMVAEQYKIMRAVVPLHRELQNRGQIEVSTTPFAHPILPLLIDTNRAALDRPGATLPPRFAYPEDADGQLGWATAWYARSLGRPPAGFWPSEGAVSADVVPHAAWHGFRWMATDAGVLARSGCWGYDADDPDVLCQPRLARQGGSAVSVFFRDGWLSDRIGFHYQHAPDQEAAAEDFLRQIQSRVVGGLRGEDDRLLTVVLDGENAWGAYPRDGRPFLRALYRALERDPMMIRTVTFSEYLDGNPARDIPAHPATRQAAVHDLATGSWIDECGSAPGVDLGTWIGEPEENRGWELLRDARDALHRSGATPDSAPTAFEALYAAEGSDWFWWFGADQDSGGDEMFDDLFRAQLANVYRELDLPLPPSLSRHIVPRSVSWSFTRPVARIGIADRLTIRTNCPGAITWSLGDGAPHTAALVPAGGVMAGPQRHQVTIGPFPGARVDLRFHFSCACPGCDGRGPCCAGLEQRVHIGDRDDDGMPVETAGSSAAMACSD